MKLFLSSLTSLLLTSGVVIPIINKAYVQNLNYQKSIIVDLEENKIIDTSQDSREWYVDFEFDQTITDISFHGDGLQAYMGWGPNKWDYSWDNFEVIDDGKTRTIFRDDYTSGMVKRTALLEYNLGKIANTTYRFKLLFFTKSYNSLMECWGRLIIGDSLTFISDPKKNQV